MNDLDTALRATYHARSRTSEPPGLLADVLAIPDVEITGRHRWLPHPARRFQSMFSATKLVVAGAVVALFGSILAVGLLDPVGDQADPAVLTPSSEPYVLPSEIPADLESGVLETPLGPARWVRVTGSPVAAVGPVAGEDGYAALDPWETKLWRSTDLLSWTERPMPAGIEAAELDRSTGSWWLRTWSDGWTLWRSDDLEGWVPIDTSALSPGGPQGLFVPGYLGETTELDGTTLVTVWYGPADIPAWLGLPTGPDGPTYAAGGQCFAQVEPGVYRARTNSSDVEEMPLLRFEETPAGLRVIDATDGSTLRELHGIDRAAMESLLAILGESADGDCHRGQDSPELLPSEWTKERGIAVTQLAMVEGDRLVPIEGTGHPDARLELVRTDDGLTLLEFQGDARVGVRHSVDGVEWTPSVLATDEAGRIIETEDWTVSPAGVELLLEGWGTLTLPRVLRLGDDGSWVASNQPYRNSGSLVLDEGAVLAELIGGPQLDGMVVAVVMGRDRGYDTAAGLRLFPAEGEPVDVDLRPLGLTFDGSGNDSLYGEVIPDRSVALAIGEPGELDEYVIVSFDELGE